MHQAVLAARINLKYFHATEQHFACQPNWRHTISTIAYASREICSARNFSLKLVFTSIVNYAYSVINKDLKSIVNYAYSVTNKDFNYIVNYAYSVINKDFNYILNYAYSVVNNDFNYIVNYEYSVINKDFNYIVNYALVT